MIMLAIAVSATSRHVIASATAPEFVIASGIVLKVCHCEARSDAAISKIYE